MINEVAGNIRVKLFNSDDSVNQWLDKFSDTEIVDIKLVCGESEWYAEPWIMIVYRPEET